MDLGNELVNRGYMRVGQDVEVGVNALLNNTDNLPDNWESWDLARKSLAAKQIICFIYFLQNNIDVPVGSFDGRMGPLTHNAIDTYDRMQSGGPAVTGARDAAMADVRTIGGAYTINMGARNALPMQSQAAEYYGEVGTNQVVFHSPFPLLLAWETSTVVTKFQCHELCHDDFGAIFADIESSYSSKEIADLHINYFGGCLNVRKMRGGSAWSMHSWGSAIDMDPDRNMLNTKWRSAQFSKPEYVPFVNAFLKRGWVSLGLEHDMDAMHFQRMRVR